MTNDPNKNEEGVEWKTFHKLRYDEREKEERRYQFWKATYLMVFEKLMERENTKEETSNYDYVDLTEPAGDIADEALSEMDARWGKEVE